MGFEVLAISGSLRSGSSNLGLLRAAARLAPTDLTIRIYDAIGELPLFNPDRDVAPWPAPVAAFRAAVGAADALLISTPEYAHGLPGALKNALDWLVSAEQPIGKLAALWNAAPTGGEFAQTQLAEILRTMSLRVVMEASLLRPFLRTKVPADGTLDEPQAEARLQASLRALMDAARRPEEPTGDAVIEADLSRPSQAAAVVELLDMYARDPMANGASLPDNVKRDVVHGLRSHPGSLVFLAYRAGRPVGIAVCFIGYTTFAAKQLIYIHDLAVAPAGRRSGVGRALLSAIEQRAVALDCCKITLEVMDNNAAAKTLYADVGFEPRALEANDTQMTVWQKTL